MNSLPEILIFLSLCVCHESEDCVFLRYGFVTPGGYIQGSNFIYFRIVEKRHFIE